MQRIYYLTDTLDSAEQISEDLHGAGITDWNFHVLSKDEAGLHRRHIHSANYIHKLDTIRDAERGALIGFACGLAGIFYLASAQTFGPNPSMMAHFTILLTLTLFGAWTGGLVGTGIENQKIRPYHDLLEAGQHLILIDVKSGGVEQVKALMAAKHPEARFQRIGSTHINPFKFHINPA